MTVMNQTPEPTALAQLDRVQRAALLVGGGGLALFVVLALLMGFDQAMQSYLMAYFFWFGLGLGCLALAMIQYLSGGRWGFIIRRLLEAGGMTLPVLAALFLPVVLLTLFGNTAIYNWADPAYMQRDPIVMHKAGYLAAVPFTVRTIVYFVIWSGLAYMLYRLSNAQDRAPDGDFGAMRQLRLISGLGLVLYVITMTTASVDWAMSLEPHFFSTMYGVLFMVGQGLSTFAFIIVLLALIGSATPYREVLTADRIHDLGKLMLAFVVLWTYVSFGQYVIIWSGNIPEFTPWYQHRMDGAWQVLVGALILFHFFLPFLLLLSRRLKRGLSYLWMIAAGILVMRIVDIFWLVAPDFTEGSFRADPAYAVALVALGGIWLWFFIWWVKQRPLLPSNDLRNDPRMYPGGHGHD